MKKKPKLSQLNLPVDLSNDKFNIKQTTAEILKRNEYITHRIFSDNIDHEKIAMAIDLAFAYGQWKGEEHKMWVIDQMIRVLIGNEQDYLHLVEQFEMGLNESLDINDMLDPNTQWVKWEKGKGL